MYSTVWVLLLFVDFVQSAEDDTNQVNNVQTKKEGPSQYLVTCFESPQFCAEEFKRVCPDGHRVEGYFRNEYDHGQINARISCTVPQEN
jgi:thioredoxin-related protein